MKNKLPPFSDYDRPNRRRFMSKQALSGLVTLLVSWTMTQTGVQAIDQRALLRKLPKTLDSRGESSGISPKLPGSTSSRSSREETTGIFNSGFGPFWIPLGPSPIPNGQTLPLSTPRNSPTEQPVSGRVNVIAVDPSNSNLVYVGPAQGGIYRSSDGGRHWTQLFTGAGSLAIGSIAIDPIDHNKVFIGTGEGNFSGDSHFGLGLYVIEDATEPNPRLMGPFGATVLGSRAITSVVVCPTNDNIVFCATSSAFGGLGSATGPTPPPARPLSLNQLFQRRAHIYPSDRRSRSRYTGHLSSFRPNRSKSPGLQPLRPGARFSD